MEISMCLASRKFQQLYIGMIDVIPKPTKDLLKPFAGMFYWDMFILWRDKTVPALTTDSALTT